MATRGQKSQTSLQIHDAKIFSFDNVFIDNLQMQADAKLHIPLTVNH